jgi:hypothetical protein
MKKYYIDENEFQQLYCDNHDCKDCKDPDLNNCEGIDTWEGDEESQLVIDADCTVFVSLEDYQIAQKTIQNLKNEVNKLKLIKGINQ